MAGFGALLGALAFPLDDYWHTLYGIDVTLWAPFHVMIISSMVMVGVGTLFVIASELNSRDIRPRRGRAWYPSTVPLVALREAAVAAHQDGETRP